MPRARDPRTLIPERAVLKACLAVLRASGVDAWRRNVVRMPAVYKGKTRFIRAGEKGAADITGTLNGLRLEVETKRYGERPTDDQVAWLLRTNRQGGIGLWVETAEQLHRVLPRLLAGWRVDMEPNGSWSITDEEP